MLVNDFFIWAQEQSDKELKIMKDKGFEYTINDKDKLKNFKHIGERMKLRPEQVAMVYLLKHMDSVTNYVNEGIEASDEPIEGRLMDIRNYCLLLGALIKEQRESADSVR
tara:strand:+ start:1130 stop:1459 length:330 start_codon:yes stop_codon:yes gene_type:complete